MKNNFLLIIITFILFLMGFSEKNKTTANDDASIHTKIMNGYWKIISPNLPEWAANYAYINKSTFTILSVDTHIRATHEFPQSGFLYFQPPGIRPPITRASQYELDKDPSLNYDNRTGYYKYNKKEDLMDFTYLRAAFKEWHLIGIPAKPADAKPWPTQAPTLLTFHALFIDADCSNAPPTTTNDRLVNYSLQRLDTDQLYLRRIAATELFEYAPDGPFGLDLERTLDSLKGPFNGYPAPEMIKIPPEQAPALLRTYGDWKDQHPDSDTCDTPPGFPWSLGQTNAIRTHLGSPLLPLPEQR